VGWDAVECLLTVAKRLIYSGFSCLFWAVSALRIYAVPSFSNMRFASFAKRVPLFVGLLMALALAPLHAQQRGQDYWQITGGSLSVPNQASRKCIAISESAIYVGTLNASSKCTTVEQYTLSGAYTKTWTASFTDIHGLACDNTGNVYAYDMGASKVRVFSGSGVASGSWGSAGTGNGQFSLSTGTVMVHAIAVDESKNVYVADRGNSRVQVFDSAGAFKRSIGQLGDLPGQFQGGPAAVAVSPEGLLLAYDSPFDWYHISQFSLTGVFNRRTAQNTSSYYESGSPNFGAKNGFGGDKAFSISRDGLLIVGAEGGLYSTTVAGASRIFQCNNLAQTAYAAFSTYVVTRGIAFDPSGNIWAVRDKFVERLERKMRFDVYKPTKALPQPVILNVSQQPGSTVVDIDYKVTDTDSATVETALVAFVGGTRTWDKLVVPKTFPAGTSGLLGTGVPTGTKLRVSWDAAADMPGQNFASLAFEMIATDGRDFVGVHYVTLPADSTYATNLKISNKPVQDADLWDLFLWLLAKGDSRLSVSGTNIVLTAAGQSYISGAPPLISGTGTSVLNTVHNGSVITTQGRQFAYKLLNCRAITAAEKTRAAAGNFNLNSVDGYSVISLVP
jgi:hypothetical protein